MAAVVSSSTHLPSFASAPVNVADGFSAVTEGLITAQAVTVARYLDDTVLIPAVLSTSTVRSQPPPGPFAPESEHPTIPRAVARLHQACQSTFGNTEALSFEYEGNLPAVVCVLTITRPQGHSRKYQSPTPCARKYDAKASASSVAIENGAIDFILAGEGNPSANDDVTSLPLPPPPLEMEESVKTIEQACLETTGGRVKPFWLIINEPKFGRTQGCALRIRLGSRNCKVYSVNTIYNSPSEARKACAEVSLEEGVVRFIKSWDPSTFDLQGTSESHSPLSLQQYFESLPQPFPESVPSGSAVEINGPAWLNTTIQAARGGKLVPNFIWTLDPRDNLHGCLLRLERPGEVRSYLADARFSKRAEAKSAVCLLAMSEGVGSYIRGVGKAVDDKLSPQTRKHISEVLLPALNTEYRKVRGAGIQPAIEYDMELDACGAKLTLELEADAHARQPRRDYVVAAEYRNRNDAKFAVVLHAIEQGAIEFLRFRGEPPPPGYVPFSAQRDHAPLNRKRKWESGGAGGIDQAGFHTYGTHSPGWQNKRQRAGGPYQHAHPSIRNSSWRQPYNQGHGGPYTPQPLPFTPPFSGPISSGHMSTTPPQQPSSAQYSHSPGGTAPNGGQPTGAFSGAVPSGAASFQRPPGVGQAAQYTPSYHPTNQPASARPPYIPMAPQQYHYEAGIPPLGQPFAPGYQPPYQPSQYPTHAMATPNMSYYPGAPTPTPMNAHIASIYQAYPSPAKATQPQVLPSYTPQPAPALVPPQTIPPTSHQQQPEAGKGPPVPGPSNNPASPRLKSEGKASTAKPTKVVIEAAPQKNVNALFDYCARSEMPKPKWCHEFSGNTSSGDPKYKVWVVIGKTKYELPMTFTSLNQGQEKVARKVVEQLERQSGAKS